VATVEAEERPPSRDRPPPALATLVERFDPDVIDVPSGRARIRLVVDDEGAWDVLRGGAEHLPRRATRRAWSLVSARRNLMRDLFIWGRQDQLVPIGFMKHVERALPAARHLELDCGHVPQLEAPKQTHAAILRFFDR
jgi:pimeloyl-ACP methyl ester carboxylesterase